MSKQSSRGNMIERTIKAIQFIEKHRTWTAQDLGDELGIRNQNANRWIRILSIYYPIQQVKPTRYSDEVGLLPAIYKLENFRV